MLWIQMNFKICDIEDFAFSASGMKFQDVNIRLLNKGQSLSEFRPPATEQAMPRGVEEEVRELYLINMRNFPSLLERFSETEACALALKEKLLVAEGFYRELICILQVVLFIFQLQMILGFDISKWKFLAFLNIYILLGHLLRVYVATPSQPPRRRKPSAAAASRQTCSHDSFMLYKHPL